MIIRNSLLLALFGGFSILLGIVRDRLLATQVGIGEVLDIYNASFRLPDVLYALSLAFVTAATIVPYLTVEDKKGNVIDPRHKLSSVALFFAGAASLLSVVIVVTLPMYAHYIVPGFNPEQTEVFIMVTRILMIQPIILGITSIISCFAQMQNHFILYGIAPIGYSLGIIFGIVELYPLYGVYGLVYGVIIGSLISFLIQLFSLRKTKILEVLPYFSWKHIRELVALGFPRTGTNILTQVRVLFFTAFATTIGVGVLTSFLFAQKITDAVTQIIQQSLTTVSLPILSKEYFEHRISEYTRIVRKYVALLGIIGVIAGVTIYYSKDAIIWLLYGESQANTLIAYFLTGFLIALPFHMMNGYLSIGLYSTKDTKRVFYSNLIATSVAVFVCYSFKAEGAVSLVYGVVSMSVVSFVCLLTLYTKKKLI